MAATMAAACIAPASLGSKAEIVPGLKASSVSCKASRVAVVRAQQEEAAPAVQSRRAMLSLFAASVAAGAMVSQAQADPLGIKLEGPPPPIGGLPGTDSSDQARDTDAPLKERFYIQPLTPTEAIERAKESAAQIIAVKGLIEKKAWPYVQNDLRSKAGYLRYDLTTVINAKPKDEKKELTALANKLYDSIADLDYAARVKSLEKATKSYDETVKLLNDVLSKAA